MSREKQLMISVMQIGMIFRRPRQILPGDQVSVFTEVQHSIKHEF